MGNRPYLVGIHRVKSFGRWKKVFDSRVEARRAAGCLGGEVYRGPNDPNVAIVVLEWDNIQNLEVFLSNVDTSAFQQVLEEAGVIGKPETHIIYNAGRTSA